MIRDSHLKSITKSITWRIVGIFWLATITWIFTHNWVHVSLITLIHHGIFIVVFYLHERAWLKSRIKPKWKYLLKAITYEIVLGNLILAFISYLITGNLQKMTMITLVYIQSKIAFYYFYDWLWSRKTKRVVFVQVVCEIFHVGHLRYLQLAKKQGDYLIASVNTDSAVEERAKLLNKPISVVPFEERARIVANIKCVDEVVSQPDYLPFKILEKIKPDVLIQSSEHCEDFRKGREFVKSYGGKIVEIDYYEPQSVTKIKKKIFEQMLVRK